MALERFKIKFKPHVNVQVAVRKVLMCVTVFSDLQTLHILYWELGANESVT